MPAAGDLGVGTGIAHHVRPGRADRHTGRSTRARHPRRQQGGDVGPGPCRGAGRDRRTAGDGSRWSPCSASLISARSSRSSQAGDRATTGASTWRPQAWARVHRRRRPHVQDDRRSTPGPASVGGCGGCQRRLGRAAVGVGRAGRRRAGPAVLPAGGGRGVGPVLRRAADRGAPVAGDGGFLDGRRASGRAAARALGRAAGVGAPGPSVVAALGLLDTRGRLLPGLPPAVVQGRDCDAAAGWRAAVLTAGRLIRSGRIPALVVACPGRRWVWRWPGPPAVSGPRRAPPLPP